MFFQACKSLGKIPFFQQTKGQFQANFDPPPPKSVNFLGSVFLGRVDSAVRVMVMRNNTGYVGTALKVGEAKRVRGFF